DASMGDLSQAKRLQGCRRAHAVHGPPVSDRRGACGLQDMLGRRDLDRNAVRPKKVIDCRILSNSAWSFWADSASACRRFGREYASSCLHIHTWLQEIVWVDACKAMNWREIRSGYACD